MRQGRDTGQAYGPYPPARRDTAAPATSPVVAAGHVPETMGVMTHNVLVTIPISHYCEKARWALDRAGIDYVERAHLQVLHRVAALRAGGGRTVPVFVCEAGVLSDSAHIVRHASRRAAPSRRLYPDDPDVSEEIGALERDLDARLGPAGRLWLYHGLRGRRDIAIRYGTTGVPAWQRRALPIGYPVVISIVHHMLGVDDENAVAAEREVRQTFDSVGERLSDGRPYLMGETFTAADLTFSALAAPMLMPPEYGVALPRPDELPAAMGDVVRELRAHPAGAHALRMYGEERPR